MFNVIARQQQVPASRPDARRSMADTLWGAQQATDRALDRLFHGFDLTLASNGWRAPLAVWEDEQDFQVEVELAGIAQDGIDVTVENRQLVICYERRVPENRQFTYNERQYGQFERRLQLPDTVDLDAIRAEMRDGLLHISVPKKAEAQRRRIEVQTG
jgi:HSP20 family protein